MVKEDLVSEWDIYETLAERMHLEMVDLTLKAIPEGMHSIIPETMIRDYNIVPIDEVNGRLVFATSNPLDYRVVYTVSNYVKRKVKMVVSTPSQIKVKQDEMFNSDQQAKMYDEAQEYIMQQMKAGEENKKKKRKMLKISLLLSWLIKCLKML